MAYPFIPMTDDILKKLTRMMQDSISTAKFSEPPFALASTNTIPTEELNSKQTETNQPPSPHLKPF